MVAIHRKRPGGIRSSMAPFPGVTSQISRRLLPSKYLSSSGSAFGKLSGLRRTAHRRAIAAICKIQSIRRTQTLPEGNEVPMTNLDSKGIVFSAENSSEKLFEEITNVRVSEPEIVLAEAQSEDENAPDNRRQVSSLGDRPSRTKSDSPFGKSSWHGRPSSYMARALRV